MSTPKKGKTTANQNLKPKQKARANEMPDMDALLKDLDKTPEFTRTRVATPASKILVSTPKESPIIKKIEQQEVTIGQKNAEIEKLQQDLVLASQEKKFIQKMPVSGFDVEFRLEVIDPELIDVSSDNARIQSLLDKAAVSDLLPSIQYNGQQKPGTLRPSSDGRYELVEGSRRLFCCKILKKNYLAFVGAIPDTDVRLLSEIENKHNEISLYEIARLYARDVEQGKYRNWAALAADKGISKSNATRYKRLAEMDEVFIRCFSSPTKMPLRFADWIMKIWTASGNTSEKKILLEKAQSLAQDKIQRIESENPLLTEQETVRQLKLSLQSPRASSSTIVHKSSSNVPVLKESKTAKGRTRIEVLVDTPNECDDKIREAIIKIIDVFTE